MNNLNKSIIMFVLLPFLCSAQQVVPNIGKKKADSHVVCGKDINIQIQKMDDNSLIIGIVNKQTKKMDYFVSNESVADNMHITRYFPVKYDELSGQFVKQVDDKASIIWGASLSTTTNTRSYTLALGTHVYNCGMVEKWPDDTADELYGEDSNTK